MCLQINSFEDGSDCAAKARLFYRTSSVRTVIIANIAPHSAPAWLNNPKILVAFSLEMAQNAIVETTPLLTVQANTHSMTMAEERLEDSSRHKSTLVMSKTHAMPLKTVMAPRL